MTVLNPLGRVDKHIMDDADLAGPFVFCFAFAFVLLLVSYSTPTQQSTCMTVSDCVELSRLKSGFV